MSGRHFEAIAEAYADARPPYPAALYDALAEDGVIGPGVRVLEVGAGAGLATAELVAHGCGVVAVEPGRRLSAALTAAVPGVEVLTAPLEEAVLPAASFDTVVAATSLHWVDLAVALPVLWAALRPGGRLAVWRHVFGDDEAPMTDFRRHVADVVAHRPDPGEPARELRPTVDELTSGGRFALLGSRTWSWSIDLDADGVGRLFATFSDWSAGEVARVAAAAAQLGGVTEHYRTVLHVLRRVDSPPD